MYYMQYYVAIKRHSVEEVIVQSEDECQPRSYCLNVNLIARSHSLPLQAKG